MLLVQFVASRLRDLRAKHKMTQEQMAALLEADVKWYQRLEWGAKDLRASTIDRLAAVFGLTAAEFLAERMPNTKVKASIATAPHKPRKSTRRTHPDGTPPAE